MGHGRDFDRGGCRLSGRAELQGRSINKSTQENAGYPGEVVALVLKAKMVVGQFLTSDCLRQHCQISSPIKGPSFLSRWLLTDNKENNCGGEKWPDQASKRQNTKGNITNISWRVNQ